MWIGKSERVSCKVQRSYLYVFVVLYFIYLYNLYIYIYTFIHLFTYLCFWWVCVVSLRAVRRLSSVPNSSPVFGADCELGLVSCLVSSCQYVSICWWFGASDFGYVLICFHFASFVFRCYLRPCDG